MEAAAAPYDHNAQLDLELASNVVFALGQLTPNHDVAGLRELDAFCQELLDHRAARLKLHGVSLSVGMSKAHLAVLPEYLSRLETYRADFASRLGDDAQGLRLTSAARETCAWCPPPSDRGRPPARPGRSVRRGVPDSRRRERARGRGAGRRRPRQIDAAHAAAATAATASGPAQVNARAQELAYLQLWGRAYDTLAPYKAEILASAATSRGRSPSSRIAPASPRPRARRLPRSSRRVRSTATSTAGRSRWAGSPTIRPRPGDR